jgi:hypothetical protein
LASIDARIWHQRSNPEHSGHRRPALTSNARIQTTIE